MKLIAADKHVPRLERPNILELANDVDPRSFDLQGIRRIDLYFPRYSDGRALTQAFLLRRRMGFQGEIRATGDVLIEQLQQIKRSGFSAAVLRADQDMAAAQRQLGATRAIHPRAIIEIPPRFLQAA